MYDLVKQETERIESRFLEPACGNGNFLAEILSRKLDVVKSRYKENPFDYERYSLLAMTSLYEVDILEDNVKECRQRLFDIWDKEYIANAKAQANEQCREMVQFILDKNIICGNTLTALCNDGTPITFIEWNITSDNQLEQHEFKLDEMLKENEG